jgi:hypothetical protein
VRSVNAARARRWALLVALGVTWHAAPTRAAPCAHPDLLDAVPPDRATGVPPNATLQAHYDISAAYAGEDVVLGLPDGSQQAVTVAFDATQGLLTYTPGDPFPPGDYTLTWPGLWPQRGVSASGPGRGALVHFTVGATADTTAPTFAGLTAVTWDVERKNNDCTSALEDRMVFTLGLGAADDDGGRASLTLVVFQTTGAAVDGGSVPVLTRAVPPLDKPQSLQVRLPVGDAVGRICFNALARDLTGKTSAANHEVCAQTTAPPFFRGCAVAPGSARGSATGCVVAMMMAAGALVGRRGRRGRRDRRRRCG